MSSPVLRFVAIAVLLYALLPLTIQGQELIIEEEEGPQTDTLAEYWDKHFTFRFGATSSMGLDTDDYRNYSFANLGWKHDFDWIAFNFEAEAYRRDYRYTLEFDSTDAQNEIENIDALERSGFDLSPEDVGRRAELREQVANTPEIVFFAGENSVLYREANVALNFFDHAQLSLGYHTIVWGQVEGFSPVDYVLPLRFASGNLTFSKVNNRLPQQAAILSIFPIRQIEIQGYYFPELILDQTLRDGFEDFGAEDLDTTDGRQDQIEEAFAFPKKSKEPQYAGRILFYLDWATFGFTYYENWDQFTTDDNRSIEAVMGMTRPGIPDPNIGSRPYIYYRSRERPRMVRTQNYGFESSVPIGKWSIRLDVQTRIVPRSAKLDSLSLHNDIRENPSISSDSSGGQSREAQDARQALIDYAIEENNGSLDYDIRETIAALEVYGGLDTWLISIGLAGIDEENFTTEGKELSKLEEAVDKAENQDEEVVMNVAPFINIGRYLSENKEDIIGVTAGFLGGIGFGAAVYFGQEYFESLQVGFSLEFIQLFSNNEIEDQFEDYELKNDIFPAFRWLLLYKF